ncbi:Uncharacterised protein [Vibrio cholerae]|nr:Uncharacterised protein [Vibrio cholerae]
MVCTNSPSRNTSARTWLISSPCCGVNSSRASRFMIASRWPCPVSSLPLGATEVWVCVMLNPPSKLPCKWFGVGISSAKPTRAS